jgi:hypothetical protein
MALMKVSLVLEVVSETLVSDEEYQTKQKVTD